MNASNSRSSMVLARPLRAVSLLLALGSAAACTAILAPRDEVQRCGNADDCDPTGDERYVATCVSSDANIDTTKYDKICVADYNPQLGCNPENYTTGPGGEHPFYVTWKKTSCSSPSCPDENRGHRGCPLLDGGCVEGQGTVQSFGDSKFCGDEGEIPAFALNDELEGQQVKDQFCKSYFCEEDFVCKNSTNKCVPCVPDAEYGNGGCGTVVNDGGPAAVYVLGDALQDGCAGPDPNTDEPLFGAC